MNNNSVLIGTFVKKNKILFFLEMLKNKFKINYNKIFVFSIDNNNFEYLVTFNTLDKEKFLKNINNSTVMHVKNGCLFSINALNKLIEKQTGKSDKDFKICWDDFKNKLIILTKGNLAIESINKIDDKCQFFN